MLCKRCYLTDFGDFGDGIVDDVSVDTVLYSDGFLQDDRRSERRTLTSVELSMIVTELDWTS